MTRRRSDFMRVDSSFWDLLNKKVIRDGHERRFMRKLNPNTKVYSSFKDATYNLAKDLKDKW